MLLAGKAGMGAKATHVVAQHNFYEHKKVTAVSCIQEQNHASH